MSAPSVQEELRRDASRYADGIALEKARRLGISVPNNHLDPGIPAHAGLIALWVASRKAYIAAGGLPPSSSVTTISQLPPSFSLSSSDGGMQSYPATSQAGAVITPSSRQFPPDELKLDWSGQQGQNQMPQPGNTKLFDKDPTAIVSECDQLKRELLALVEKAKAGVCTGDDGLAEEISGRMAEFAALKASSGEDLFSQLPVRYRIAARAVAEIGAPQGSGAEIYQMDYDRQLRTAVNAYAASMAAGDGDGAVRDKVMPSLRIAFTEASAQAVYARIQTIGASAAGLAALKNADTDKAASSVLGFRKQCKEFVDSIVNAGGGKALRYGEVPLTNALTSENAVVGKALYSNTPHAMIITGVQRDKDTNAVTAVVVAEANWSSDFKYLYGRAAIPGQLPWERKVTPRTITVDKFASLRVANVDGIDAFQVKDFWLKDPVSASAGGNNFDGQFKVMNGHPCAPIGLNAMALQVVDARGQVVLDQVQKTAALAGGATAHMDIPATQGSIARPGTYTAIAKISVDGQWREVGRQSFTVGP